MEKIWLLKLEIFLILRLDRIFLLILWDCLQKILQWKIKRDIKDCFRHGSILDLGLAETGTLYSSRFFYFFKGSFIVIVECKNPPKNLKKHEKKIAFLIISIRLKMHPSTLTKRKMTVVTT